MKTQSLVSILEQVIANKYLKDYFERIIIIGFVGMVIANRTYNHSNHHHLDAHKQNQLVRQPQKLIRSKLVSTSCKDAKSTIC
jgi:hypothetical protein